MKICAGTWGRPSSDSSLIKQQPRHTSTRLQSRVFVRGPRSDQPVAARGRCVISDPARLECLSKVLGASPQPERHEQNQPPGYLGNKVFILFIYFGTTRARAHTHTQRGFFSTEEMFCGEQRVSLFTAGTVRAEGTNKAHNEKTKGHLEIIYQLL